MESAGLPRAYPSVTSMAETGLYWDMVFYYLDCQSSQSIGLGVKRVAQASAPKRFPLYSSVPSIPPMITGST
jgi:hypothetical protein